LSPPLLLLSHPIPIRSVPIHRTLTFHTTQLLLLLLPSTISHTRDNDNITATFRNTSPHHHSTHSNHLPRHPRIVHSFHPSTLSSIHPPAHPLLRSSVTAPIHRIVPLLLVTVIAASLHLPRPSFPLLSITVRLCLLLHCTDRCLCDARVVHPPVLSAIPSSLSILTRLASTPRSLLSHLPVMTLHQHDGAL